MGHNSAIQLPTLKLESPSSKSLIKVVYGGLWWSINPLNPLKSTKQLRGGLARQEDAGDVRHVRDAHGVELGVAEGTGHVEANIRPFIQIPGAMSNGHLKMATKWMENGPNGEKYGNILVITGSWVNIIGGMMENDGKYGMNYDEFYHLIIKWDGNKIDGE